MLHLGVYMLILGTNMLTSGYKCLTLGTICQKWGHFASNWGLVLTSGTLCLNWGHFASNWGKIVSNRGNMQESGQFQDVNFCLEHLHCQTASSHIIIASSHKLGQEGCHVGPPGSRQAGLGNRLCLPHTVEGHQIHKTDLFLRYLNKYTLQKTSKQRQRDKISPTS